LILSVLSGCTGTTDSEDSHENGDDHTHSTGTVESLHGGTIVAIGHSHVEDKVTHYYAEVMPITNQQLTLHLLVERLTGVAAAQSIEKQELVSYLNRNGDSQLNARKMVLAANAENPWTLSGQLPEEPFGKRVKVVVPPIRVAGERMSFSFEVDIPAAPPP
jgi:hypothetical protein